MARNGEHTLNTALAGCLRGKSPAWKPAGAVTSESLDTLEGGGRPDILVTPADAPPVVVETEVEPARTVEKDAASRLDRHLKSTGKPIRYAVAVRLPDELRDAPEGDLPTYVAKAQAQYAVLSSDASAGPNGQRPVAEAARKRFPRQGWIKGGVDDLAGLVENLAVSEQAIAKSTDILETAIRRAAGRLGELRDTRPVVLERIGDLLHQDPGVQTDRMAMAIVANACTFHNRVAGTPEARHIRNLDALRTGPDVVPKSRTLAQWAAILDINYWPIFAIARDILVEIPSDVAARILGGLAGAADRLAAEGVTRSHDLTGRMFQRLIQDRKFLATFYTRPEAATLLAELAVGMLDVDWGDPEAITRVRVGDLACGTGTLLLAAYHALIARCRRAGGDDARLHRKMIGNCLIGADIMPAAAHLTASMLSSVHPAVSFRRTRIYTLPYGNDPRVSRLCLGSLSLLESEAMPSLFGTGLAGGMKGLGGTGAVEVQDKETASSSFVLGNGSLDLVIMNPPFTRPTNHEATGEAVPSFAGFGTTKSEQSQMSKELKRLRTFVAKRRRQQRGAPPASNGNAGLASNFLDLAHAKLRSGGVLAMVLPQPFAPGGAWEASRGLMARHYRDIKILSLAGARSEEKAFSADTGMAEILLLGRKLSRPRVVRPNSPMAATHWISLSHRPTSAAAAAEVARAISRQREREKRREEKRGKTVHGRRRRRKSGRRHPRHSGGWRVRRSSRHVPRRSGTRTGTERCSTRRIQSHTTGSDHSPNRAREARTCSSGCRRAPRNYDDRPRPLGDHESAGSPHVPGALGARCRARTTDRRRTRHDGRGPNRETIRCRGGVDDGVAAALQPRLPVELPESCRLPDAGPGDRWCRVAIVPTQ